jgi:CheY-like chemotaxis protein/GAF domain-containing protein
VVKNHKSKATKVQSRCASPASSDVPKVLCVKSGPSNLSSTPLILDENVEVTYVNNCSEAMELLRKTDFDGFYYCGQDSKQTSLDDVLHSAAILDLVPEGLALLDSENNIIRTNKRLTSWFENSNLVGLNFYEAIGSPTIVGTEPSPLASARSKLETCRATLSIKDRFYQLTVVPILNTDQHCEQLIVTLSDSTDSVLQRQKLEALHQAGTALADLRPEEIYEMDVDQRIELLKDNILHYTKDLLKFDVVEIRLVDQATRLLKPLLSVGIDSRVAQQPLYARSTENGVTGFVAATGKSYMCEDTTDDPLYLDGLIGAKSSLTVPLIYHNQVIGSFNVESPEIGAFSESDLQFVESFARDIAVALNTLELLNAQRTDAALQSVSAIHAAVALPIDEILNDTVHAIESYIGHDPDVTARLRTILKHARQIKSAIQKVGQEMAPVERMPATVQTEIRPLLKNRRVLVIDADEQVRTSAHCLLERYGCVVETAHEGKEAVFMVRNCDTESYDAIIADIRLPDIGGYDLLMQLKELVDEPPLILMTGFGYDPGHSIVKARQAGLKANAVLFKPFRLDQLVEVVEAMVAPDEVAAAANPASK